MRFTSCLATLLALCLPCRIAAALDEGVTSTARALAQEAEQDFKDGRFPEASEKFFKAYQAVRVPTLARSAARALVQQGKLVWASELYRQAVLLQANELWIGGVQQDAQSRAREELAALMPRLSRLRIQVRGAPLAEVEVFIDDVRVPGSLLGANQYVDPGERHLLAKHGKKVIRQIVSMAEGEQRDIPLDLASEPQPAMQGEKSEPQRLSTVSKTNSTRTIGWVGIGVAAAGFAVGTTAGVLVAIKHHDSASDCPNDICDPKRVSTSYTDSYNTLRAVSVIGFAAGAVGAAAGVTLLLTTPASDKPNVSAWFSPTGAGLRGAF